MGFREAAGTGVRSEKLAKEGSFEHKGSLQPIPYLEEDVKLCSPERKRRVLSEPLMALRPG